jgi:hypothetical protein
MLIASTALGQSSIRPIQVDSVKGYFVSRPFLEFAVEKMELAPVQQRAIAALQAEVGAAANQITARDNVIAQMEADRLMLQQIINERSLQHDELQGNVALLRKKYRRMRWWRPLALGTSAAAALLAITK